MMRALVQRVVQARAKVADEVVGAIGPGLCVFLGVTHDDGTETASSMADKLASLRVLDDENGVMNLSIEQTTGALLLVSNFTLYGDASRGRRPSWSAAARSELAEPLVNAVAKRLRELGIEVATGVFGADMQVELTNDGPMTIVVEV